MDRIAKPVRTRFEWTSLIIEPRSAVAHIPRKAHWDYCRLSHGGYRYFMPEVRSRGGSRQPFRRGWRSHGVRWLASVIAASGALVVMSPANADPYGAGPPDGGLPSDGAVHDWCYISVPSSAYTSVITASMTYLDSATNVTVQQVGSGCTANTDVRWRVVDIPTSGVRGDATCTATTSTGNCNSFQVRLDPNELTDVNNRRKTACHELGHTNGLTHGGTADCMRNGAVTTATSTYSTHHIGHINNRG